MMRSTTTSISQLQKCAKTIRHICILAHVDHGKTTLADSILASNGIIPKKMVGKMRFMDSRKDEQERGITMKSSSVAIQYVHNEENYLINLIDSPGHSDFSVEVCTAVRLCDGAVILVDVVEGVCPQTKVALQQAWVEHLKPLLVLNKIDRLILEWKLTPLDAYAHLNQLLEQINAVVGELFASDAIKRSDNVTLENSQPSNETEVFDWSSGLDDSDDSSVYFSPELGNVVFASALDGWGFGLSHFAKMYSEKLGFSENVLRKTLWSDYYLNSKTQRLLKGAQAKAKKPLFVQFILENIWAVYDAVLIKQDRENVEKIVKTLHLKIPTRDCKHMNSRSFLQVLLSQWLSLSNAVLEMVCTFVPSPLNLIDEKIEGLMCATTHKFDHLPEATKQLKNSFKLCDFSNDAPIIVCVSKMIPIPKNSLVHGKLTNQISYNPVSTVSTEEIAIRREKARQIQAERSNCPKQLEDTVQPKDEDCNVSSDDPGEWDTAFIAFARIYSGTLRKGQKVYVLGPKHDPHKALKLPMAFDENLKLKDLHPDQHITIATVGDVFLLMGEAVQKLEEVPAGNVLGIAGLEGHILKSATLSSTVACPTFVDLHESTVPIMRVALEPAHPREMLTLVKGMRFLNQADPCVQVLIQESGEHVLITAGEVHLQRCINDLKERFAKIEINVSPPIVPFRETVIIPPIMDMVNEVIEDKNNQKLKKEEEDNECKGCVVLQTPNKRSTISIRAVPLPPSVTRLLEQNSSLLKEQDQYVYSLYSGECESDLKQDTVETLRTLKENLYNIFEQSGVEWAGAADQIWSFGPKRCGPNILLNRVPGYSRPSVWISSSNERTENSSHFNYDSSFISGFQLATLAGPLCDEPLMGVCFIVEEWTIKKEVSIPECDVSKNSSKLLEAETDDVPASDALSICSSGPSSITPYGPFTGQIMSTVKEACRKAFQARPQRLMAAMYSCNIQITADVLGKMYAVLGRRHGRVLHADLQEGSQTFFVSAELPVVESFDFANEIRKQTSGMAHPQLLFSHWEVVDMDPFWVPHTEEEYAHFGEKADSENRSRKYMNAIRRRKGLPVDEKIVEHGEKQRTLMRKK